MLRAVAHVLRASSRLRPPCEHPSPPLKPQSNPLPAPPHACRAKAAQCIALYVLVDPAPSRLASAALLLRGLLQGDAPAVQQAAACALSDLCVAFSAPRVDALLAGAASEGAVAGDGAAAAPAGCEPALAAGRGACEAMVQLMQKLLDRAGAGGKARAGSRWVRGVDTGQLPAFLGRACCLPRGREPDWRPRRARQRCHVAHPPPPAGQLSPRPSSRSCC